jgi:Cu-Zn family superoxide dismutase
MFAFGSFTSATTAAGPLEAKADISGEGIKGKVELKEVPAQGTWTCFLTGTMAVQVTVEVTGLKPGAHGIHLHAVGKCESPGFTSAGGHFDPGPASNMDPDANHPFHMGDLPNLVADATGKATLKTVTNRVTLREGAVVFDSDGTAIIIHANPDEAITAESKAGKSGGPRLACRVAERLTSGPRNKGARGLNHFISRLNHPPRTGALASRRVQS